MANRKGKPHNLGASARGKASHAVRKRHGSRPAISRAAGKPATGRRAKTPAVNVQYSMLIRWSEEDKAFIVTLPEFGDATTHGSTYESAARTGRELIESFIMWHRQDRKKLPAPRLFASLAPPADEPADSAKNGAGRKVFVLAEDEDEAWRY